MWSRDTVRETSHISFVCGGDPFCEIVRPADLSCGSLPSVQIYRPYIFFSSPMWKYEHPLRLPYFSVYGWLSELTYFRFFTVICWSYLRTEISVPLSIGNELYSRHHILYFSFLWTMKTFCWCYLATTLNLLSSSSPAKLVYYKDKLSTFIKWQLKIIL